MIETKRHGKVEHFVHAGDFKKMMDEADMTHEDAAIVFNVTSTTIRNWLRTGPEGIAAHFIGYMLAMNVPLRHVAGALNLQMSSLRRSSTKAGERSKLLAKASGKNQVEEVNLWSRVLQFLFSVERATGQEIMAGLGCYSSIVDLKAILDSLVDEEIIENAADLYMLAPFQRIKMETVRKGSRYV